MTEDFPVDQTWSVADAKARFSEVIELAYDVGPQTISRRGKEVAVVVSVEEWRRKSQRSGSLAEFFASSPLRGSGLDVERDESAARDVML
jgi:prevent-host-death family protein